MTDDPQERSASDGLLKRIDELLWEDTYANDVRSTALIGLQLGELIGSDRDELQRIALDVARTSAESDLTSSTSRENHVYNDAPKNARATRNVGVLESKIRRRRQRMHRMIKGLRFWCRGVPARARGRHGPIDWLRTSKQRVLFAILGVTATLPAQANITVQGQVGTVEILTSAAGAPGNFDLRIYFVTGGVICNGQTWAYINTSDNNYAATAAGVLTAKSSGMTVTLNIVQDTQGYCQLAAFWIN
jgi:hypothetical protein